MSDLRETNNQKISKAFKVIDDKLIIDNCTTEKQDNPVGDQNEYVNKSKINFKSIMGISFSFSKILKIQNLLGLTNLKVIILKQRIIKRNYNWIIIQLKR